MFKGISRLSQTKNEVVISLVVERVGVTCLRSTVVRIEWQRGKG
jgi:hypothetical protein